MIETCKIHKKLEFLRDDHQFVSLLCWRIRSGLRKSIDPLRIKAYSMCVFDDYLGFHIEMEEKYIFPVLGMEHKMVKKALADHRRINRVLQNKNDMLKSMNSIEELLELHIRFEDRMLFPEIGKLATSDHYQVIDHAKSMYSIYKEKNG